MGCIHQVIVIVLKGFALWALPDVELLKVPPQSLVGWVLPRTRLLTERSRSWRWVGWAGPAAASPAWLSGRSPPPCWGRPFPGSHQSLNSRRGCWAHSHSGQTPGYWRRCSGPGTSRQKNLMHVDKSFPDLGAQNLELSWGKKVGFFYAEFNHGCGCGKGNSVTQSCVFWGKEVWVLGKQQWLFVGVVVSTSVDSELVLYWTIHVQE